METLFKFPKINQNFVFIITKKIFINHNLYLQIKTFTNYNNQHKFK